MSGRLRITYDLTCGPGESPAEKARDVAVEQTVELPPGCYPDDLEDRVVGRIEGIAPLGGDRHRAVISYGSVTVGGEVTQLLNLLFGNISMKTGIRVSAVDWPDDVLGAMPGPRFGIAGIREMSGVPRRALTCAALKPMGMAAHGLAARCGALVAGGIDVVKDDHGVANQVTAPFRDRVLACQDAVARANAEAGTRGLYFPNVTAPHREIEERVAVARDAGCRGVLACPLLVGADAVRWLAEASGLALLLHPSLTGAFFAPDHGIAPEVLLGQVFRMVGGDGVIYANAGGRFPYGQGTCDAINGNLRGALGGLRPAFPVPGGGIDVTRAPRWLARYGPDTMLLIGGSLYRQGDLRRAASELREAVERSTPATGPA